MYVNNNNNDYFDLIAPVAHTDKALNICGAMTSSEF